MSEIDEDNYPDGGCEWLIVAGIVLTIALCIGALCLLFVR